MDRAGVELDYLPHRYTVVQAALGGAPTTTLLEADRQFGVVVRLAPDDRSSLDAVRNIKVGFATPAGPNAYIPLSDLADITLDTGASFIYREGAQRRRWCAGAVPFRTGFKQAAVGFVSLLGVSVMNGILVMTYYNQVRASGMRMIEAMSHAAEQRMRPMLMTALSACIGLLPAVVSTGIGSQVQRPLATVVVGGMFIGSILLVVVPALQTLLLGREATAAEAGA
jgi:Cu/Ag efflux pump CusA